MANLGQPIPDTAHVGCTWSTLLHCVLMFVLTLRLSVSRCRHGGPMWATRKAKSGFWAKCRTVIRGNYQATLNYFTAELVSCRFFVHHSIRAFAEALVARHGKVGEEAMLFPSTCVASRCLDFMIMHASLRSGPLSQPTESNGKDIRLMDLVLCRSDVLTNGVERRATMISAVLFPKSSASLAAEFWQHSGEGISSRRAEFFYKAFSEGHLVPRPDDDQDLVAVRSTLKGPRRYRKLADGSHSTTNIRTAEDPHYCSSALDNAEYVQFIEERFGRNLDLSFATSAKLAIRRRIAGSLKANTDLNEALDLSNDTILFRHGKHFSEDDVYLYPTGMSSIFNTHRILRTARGPMKSIMFGYVKQLCLKTITHYL